MTILRLLSCSPNFKTNFKKYPYLEPLFEIYLGLRYFVRR